MYKFIFCLCASLFLAGCGYQFGTGSFINSYKTISVPYVEGDWDGSITTAIVRQIGLSSRLRYKDSGGSLTLLVKVLNYYDENIGFRYDQKKSGEPKNVIIPDETRTTIVVELFLIEAASGQTLAGPVQISAEVEYDHDYYNNRHGVNVFSLGQLSDVEEAYDAAQRPLNKRLAEKILDYVVNHW